MYKVYLLGSNDINTLPYMAEAHIANLVATLPGQVEFILRGSNRADEAYNMALSRLGASSISRVYSVGEPRKNLFELPVKKFDIEVSDETSTVTFRNSEDANEVDTIQTDKPITKDEALLLGLDKDFITGKLCNDCSFAICSCNTLEKSLNSILEKLRIRDKYIYMYK